MSSLTKTRASPPHPQYSDRKYLIVRPTKKEISRCIADIIISRLNAFKATSERPHYVLGLPTGSSPELIYAHLVAAFKAGRLSFRHLVTFNMDEYVGLEAAHSQSYHTFMFQHLFAHVDILPENVHLLNGTAPNLDEESARYEAAIARHGPIDLFLAGVGTTGHVAFNEPFSSPASRTRPVALAPATRAANARFFGDDPAAVPARALTVGLGTVLEAHEIVVVATGRAKAAAVREAVEGAVSARWPVTWLQGHGRCTLAVDAEAGGELSRGTVEYFEQLEQVEGEPREPNKPDGISSKL